MQTNQLFRLTIHIGLLLYGCLPQCQLYSQQAEVAQSFAVKPNLQPKLVKTQGSNEHDNVRFILESRNGDLWFATTGEGVYRYNGKGFVQYTKADGLSSDAVYSMIEDFSGNIWFGTDHGVSRYDGKSIVSVPFEFDRPPRRLLAVLTSGDLPETSNKVWSIFQLNSGSLWFGTSNSVYCYDGSKFTRLLDDLQLINAENLKLKKIQCMLQDQSGTIWLGSGLDEREGLIRIDGQTIATVKPKIDTWIRHILQDKSGAIWLSTRNQGIWRNKGDGFARLTIQNNDVTNLLQANVGMMQDSKGNIWFGGGESSDTVLTNSGIWRYDGVNFKNFTVEDGLSGYSVSSILKDSNGHIWIGTRNTGLARSNGDRFETMSE